MFIIYGSSNQLNNIDLSNFTTTAGIKVIGKNISNRIGHTLASGDFNNDTISDVLIGSNFYTGGEVYILYGKTNPPNFIDLNSLPIADGFTIASNTLDERFGQYVDFIGDTNGDGFEDILISGKKYSNFQGRASVIYGNATQNNTLYIDSLDNNNGFTITGSAQGDKFSSSVSGIGDFNNDGLADYAIGDLGNAAVYIFYDDANIYTGCTDPTAQNFDSEALCDDGSCN